MCRIPKTKSSRRRWPFCTGLLTCDRVPSGGGNLGSNIIHITIPPAKCCRTFTVYIFIECARVHGAKQHYLAAGREFKECFIGWYFSRV